MATARSRRARSRSGSGGWSRIGDVGDRRAEVRVLLEVPHQRLDVGHPSVGAHLAVTAHASDATRAVPRRDRQRGIEVCLNSLSSGQPSSRSRTRSMVRVACAPSPSGRSIRRTKAAWSPTDEGGDAPDLVVLGGAPRAPADGLEGVAGGDRGEHGVGVDALRGRARPARRPRRGGGRRGRGGARTRPRGRRGSARDAGRGRPRRPGGRGARCRRASGPRCGLALGDVDLAEREGHERARPTARRPRRPATTCSWALRANGQR